MRISPKRSEQVRNDPLQVGIVAHAARGMSGDKAQHRHRHVGDQFGPDRLPYLVHRRRLDRSVIERGPQPFDPRAAAVVAFADQQHVAVGGKIGHDAGRDHLIRRKDHAADDPLFGDDGAQRAAGIEKAEFGRRRLIGASPISYHQGMPFWANTTAVSSCNSGGAR